jgi:hypothetical protein
MTPVDHFPSTHATWIDAQLTLAEGGDARVAGDEPREARDEGTLHDPADRGEPTRRAPTAEPEDGEGERAPAPRERRARVVERFLGEAERGLPLFGERLEMRHRAGP